MIWIWRILNDKTPRPPDKAIKWNDVKPLFELYYYLIGVSFAVFVLELTFYKMSKIIRRRSKIPKEKNVKNLIVKRKMKMMERKGVVFHPTKELEKIVLGNQCKKTNLAIY